MPHDPRRRRFSAEARGAGHGARKSVDPEADRAADGQPGADIADDPDQPESRGGAAGVGSVRTGP